MLIFLFNANLSMMNIRDYIFIKKAKSSNKIRILELLGFESNTNISQSPELIKNIEDNFINNNDHNIDIELEKNDNIYKESDFHKFITSEIEKKETSTETFEPIKITSHLKKIWIDIETRRKWLIPAVFTFFTILVISLASSIYINNRNNEIEISNLYSTLTNESNLLVNDLNDIIAVSSAEYYSKYDVSNASAKLQLIESTLMEYERNLSQRGDIVVTLDLNNNLKSIFKLINDLDDLITYRILLSEILLYDDILTINEELDIDLLSSSLSEISATSKLNYENLPSITEFNNHYQLLEVTLISAEDLHGRLIAALRNNETEVAESMIIAINLNKNTEQIAFYNSLNNFRTEKIYILNNIDTLP